MNDRFLQEQAVKSDYIAHYIIPVITVIGDYIAIILSEKLVWELTNFILEDKFNLVIPKMYFYFWIPAVFIFFLFKAGAHKRMIPYFETVKNIFCAVFYATVAAIFILYLIHSINDLSRMFVIMLFIMSCFFICVVNQIIVAVCNKINIF